MSGFVGRLTRQGPPNVLSAPRAVAARGCLVALHGTIANLRQLRVDDVYDPHSPSDAETIAHAYRRWGRDLQPRLLGEYALALFDEDAGLLLLTHDALGIVPLFYADTAGELTFGTNLEEVVDATGIGEIDEDYVADFLAGLEDHGERTPYRHIRRLRPGFSAFVRGGIVRTARTYDPSKLRPLRLGSAMEYEEECRRLAIDAVASALPAVGKVWCELSGGLDSSTVLSIAAGTLRADVEAFSVVFSRSQNADETPWIDTVLKAYPLPSHRIDADSVPPFAEPPDRFHAEPTGALLITAFDRARAWLLREHGVDVVLTGNGGDALFVGDAPEPYYLADCAVRDPVRIHDTLRPWQQGGSQGRPLGFWFLRYVLQPRLRRLLRRSVIPARAHPPWIRPEYSTRWRLDRRGERQRLFGLSIGDEYFWERIGRGALLVSRSHTDLEEPAVYRNPWLDLPLVEFMAAVPWAEKLRPGDERWLQRRAMRGVLPERTRLRRGKRGPIQAFFSGLHSGEAWLSLLTRQTKLVERGYVDGHRWREAVNAARFGSCPTVPGFLQACVLEAWFKMLEVRPRRSRRLEAPVRGSERSVG